MTLTRVRVLHSEVFALKTRVHSGELPGGTRFFARVAGRLVTGWPATRSGADAELTVAAGAESAGPESTGPESTVPGGTMTALRLDGSGTLTIGLGRGTTARSAARHPIGRVDIHYRIHAGEIELLTPFEPFGRGRYGDSRRWFAVGPGVRSSLSLDTDAVPVRKE